jgi:hypothetical protein
MGIKQLSDGGPDGTKLGQSSTDKLGFYALTTPIARPSVTWPNTTTGTTTTNKNKVNRLKTALVNLGLLVTT